MIHHLALRLRDFHALGYVHRDLKPGNVMWLPRENRWTILDFGCAARVGVHAPLAYTLVYAPPEVMAAAAAGVRTTVAAPALDAWSLGVLAFELLTGAPAFRLLTDGRDQVCHQPRNATLCALHLEVFLLLRIRPPHQKDVQMRSQWFFWRCS